MKPNQPSHWIEYTSDSGWYSLSYPRNWIVERRGAVVEFFPPHRQAKLVLQGIKLSPRGDVAETPRVPLEELLPRGDGIRPLAPPDLSFRCVAAEGDATTAKADPRSPDLLEDGKWDRWQAWVMECNLIVLAVSYVQRGPRDVEGETLARMIVGSIRVPDEPPDSYTQFVKRLADRARILYPQMSVTVKEDEVILFGEALISPINLYRQYVRDPGRFEAVANRALQTAYQVQQQSHLVSRTPDLDEIRERIMPMPYPRREWERNMPHLAGENWVADLAVLYVVDQQDSYWYLTREHLGTWGVSLEQLHQLAQQNLDSYFERQGGSLITGPNGEVAMPAVRDSYNASRLLSLTFRAQLRQLLGPQWVVGLPERDFFLALRPADADIVRKVRQQVSRDYDHAEYPLTKRLLYVSPDGVSEYTG